MLYQFSNRLIQLFLYYQQIQKMQRIKLKTLPNNKYILSLSKPNILLDQNNLNMLNDSDCRRSVLLNRTNFSLKTIKTYRNHQNKYLKTHRALNQTTNKRINSSKAQRSRFQFILCVQGKQIIISIRKNTVQELTKQIRKYLFQNQMNSSIKTIQSIDKDISIDYLLSIPQNSLQTVCQKNFKIKPYYGIDKKNQGLRSYQIIKKIGSGGFSNVYLVRCKLDGKFYAMKVISKSFILKRKKEKLIINEKNVMIMSSNSPFLAKLYQSFESKNYFILVIDYYPGGELFSLLNKYKRMVQDMARFYIIEILFGLQELHSLGIAYRDLKPQNILLDMEGHIRIADFGLVKPGLRSNTTRTFSFCGSPQYMPPQIVAHQGHSLTADFYSLGALLFQLLTGLPPFYSRDCEKIYKKTLNQQIVYPNYISEKCKNLLQGLLCKSQLNRLGSQNGVQQILKHCWFGRVDRQAFLNKSISPPISFSFKDIALDLGKTKEANQQSIQAIKKQQLENNSFTQIMPDFRFSRFQSTSNKYKNEQKQVPCQDTLFKKRSIKMAPNSERYKRFDNFF